MEDFNSKYTGAEVEALLDKVEELDAQMGDINTILESIINE